MQQQEPEQVPSHDEQACCSVVCDEGQSRDKEEKEEEEEKEKRIVELVRRSFIIMEEGERLPLPMFRLKLLVSS